MGFRRKSMPVNYFDYLTLPKQKFSLLSKKLKYWGNYLNWLQFPKSKQNNLRRNYCFRLGKYWFHFEVNVFSITFNPVKHLHRPQKLTKMTKMVKKAKVATTSALYVEVRFRRPRYILSADMYSVTDVLLSICAGMANVP